MVSVLPEAVASITLDWSGPVTRRRSGPPPLIVSARSLHRRFSGGELVDVVLGTAPAYTPGGNPMVAMPVPPYTMISPAPIGFVEVIRTHPSTVSIGGRLQARRAERHVDIGGDLICGLRQRPQ